MHFQIIDLPDAIKDSLEQLGTKEKFWFYDPADNVRKLFKIGRPNTGENWAEKASCELAKLIGLPCVEYQFARWEGNEGVISPLLVPKNGRLIHGNEILAKIIKGYPITKRYKVKEYQLKSVLAIIKIIPQLLPIGYGGNSIIKCPLDVFLGYIIFDCWIANQDRHHENWGMVLDTNKPSLHLSPTYDHASGLGCRVPDRERRGRLTTKDTNFSIEAFAKRAITPFYNMRSRYISTIDVVMQSSRQNKIASAYWINRIEEISRNELVDIFQKIPEKLISEPAIDFSIALLETNKNRLSALKREIEHA